MTRQRLWTLILAHFCPSCVIRGKVIDVSIVGFLTCQHPSFPGDLLLELEIKYGSIVHSIVKTIPLFPPSMGFLEDT